MTNRTCSADGCDRKHAARGLCSLHWKREHGNRKRYQRACATCGDEFLSSRQDGRFCSDLCKGHAYRIRTLSKLPRDHPVMVMQRKAPVRPVVRDAECEWCGSAFATTKATQRMCSRDCKVKAARCRRRGRAAGSTSHYTWSEVMRLFIRLGRCCAYCQQPVAGLPEPDHVVPLSRGGSNSITNILPACHLCNSDKRDLLPREWAADRERRGLPPVCTEVDGYTHLAISSAA